jgi:hypothetical protein
MAGVGIAWSDARVLSAGSAGRLRHRRAPEEGGALLSQKKKVEKD